MLIIICHYTNVLYRDASVSVIMNPYLKVIYCLREAETTLRCLFLGVENCLAINYYRSIILIRMDLICLDIFAGIGNQNAVSTLGKSNVRTIYQIDLIFSVLIR